MQKLRDEIVVDCNTFSDMVQSYCTDRTGNSLDSEVFFLTLVADFMRYTAEQTPPGTRLKDIKMSAQATYERAERKASRLHHCSTVKMSHAMHYANFEHEFMDNTLRAIKLAEAAVNSCQAALHTIPPADNDSYNDAVHLQELLKENIAIWRGQDPRDVVAGLLD